MKTKWKAPKLPTELFWLFLFDPYHFVSPFHVFLYIVFLYFLFFFIFNSCLWRPSGSRPRRKQYQFRLFCFIPIILFHLFISYIFYFYIFLNFLYLIPVYDDQVEATHAANSANFSRRLPKGPLIGNWSVGSFSFWLKLTSNNRCWMKNGHYTAHRAVVRSVSSY